jgi:hypothetical protein
MGIERHARQEAITMKTIIVPVESMLAPTPVYSFPSAYGSIDVYHAKASGFAVIARRADSAADAMGELLRSFAGDEDAVDYAQDMAVMLGALA